MDRIVFTPEERDRARDRLLEIGRTDPRVVAAAFVGSLAEGEGDRWSDLDLTFGLAQGVTANEVLADWTRTLEAEFGAVHLFDLPFRTSLYRVFLFPGSLQVDVSFTPESDFGAYGPRFRLLWGKAVERPHLQPDPPETMFGLAVHHAVRAHFCIERGRPWQAEYWISGLRDQVLALACGRHGLPTREGRGFDGLPDETLVPLREALVRSLDREELLRALGRAVEGLLRESGEAQELAAKVEGQLSALASGDWGAA
jgi:hypothetical protein